MPTDPTARFTRRQHGLVSRSQALTAGLGRDAVHYRLRSGRWRRVAAGVYAVTTAPVTWRQQVLAACLAIGGGGAVASHRTAAALWGLSGFRPGPVHVLVPMGCPRLGANATVHQTRTLLAADITRIDGIPVTRVARTLVDLAGCASERELEEAVDDALCRRLVTLDRLRRRARELCGPGRAGSAVLGRVLATWEGGAAPQEVAEARLVRRLVHAGLPPPATQVEVYDDGRFVARLDVAWPERRLGVELDGFRWHGGPRAFERDRHRRNRLVAVRWTIFQATPDDLLGDGGRVVELVRPYLLDEARNPAEVLPWPA